MNIKLSEIYKEFESNNFFEQLVGDAEITNITSIETGKMGSLVFIDNKKFLDLLKKNLPSAVITNSKLYEEIKSYHIPGIIISKNVPHTHALIKQKYADKNLFQTEWGKRHPSALIHPSAKISDTVVIGPKVVIGENVEIGERVIIQTNSVIESNAKIDDDSVIYTNVVIGYNCILGKKVYIKSGTVIGSEGFGFALSSDKKYHRIPQTGIVVIEDDVHVGANCCIDRAAYHITLIKRGTKFDNLCHVAHNVTIGEDCALTAGFIVAGSSKLGNRVITSGQCGVLDHLEIADDVILLIRPGVSNDVKESGVYAGTPLQPFSDFQKSQAIHRNLPELRKRISELEKKLK